MIACFKLYLAGSSAAEREWTFEYTTETGSTYTVGCGPAKDNGSPEVVAVPADFPPDLSPYDDPGWDENVVHGRCREIMSEDIALRNRHWTWAALLAIPAVPLVAIGGARVWRSPPSAHQVPHA